MNIGIIPTWLTFMYNLVSAINACVVSESIDLNELYVEVGNSTSRPVPMAAVSVLRLSNVDRITGQANYIIKLVYESTTNRAIFSVIIDHGNGTRTEKELSVHPRADQIHVALADHAMVYYREYSKESEHV